MPRLIQSVTLRNFLSFGDEAQTIELGDLNVLVGPNGSGKSNFLEAFDILRNTPGKLEQTIRSGGGVREWMYKQKDIFDSTELKFIVSSQGGNIVYDIAFEESRGKFLIVLESIQSKLELFGVSEKEDEFSFDYLLATGNAEISKNGAVHRIPNYDGDRTVLFQIRDPYNYPVISYLSDKFSEIRLYREWSVGRESQVRRPQTVDEANKYLEPDAKNLGLVLNFLRNYPATKRQILNYLKKLYDGVEDFNEQIEGGTIQLFLTQGDYNIPAVRLSDGTLRYLCLLTILLHPTPPPLICIEEPELGLHPDIIPVLAELLKDAATRTQVIVTTHSDILISALSDQPEAILICERDEQGTKLKRLNPEQMAPWLKKYRLGELWISGQIGGNRW